MKAMERPTEKVLESLFATDIRKVIAPAKAAVATQAVVQRVHCPTCGSYAERYYQQGTVRTQCSKCDYLMTTCAETGRVIESYAPSFAPNAAFLMTS